MKFIVRDKETGEYIGLIAGGYPRRYEKVRFKKNAKRFKSKGGIKRAIRHRVKNKVYWNAISKRQTPPPGESQYKTVFPDNYEIIEVKF